VETESGSSVRLRLRCRRPARFICSSIFFFIPFAEVSASCAPTIQLYPSESIMVPQRSTVKVDRVFLGSNVRSSPVFNAKSEPEASLIKSP
jgi:hypothetical protein